MHKRPNLSTALEILTKYKSIIPECQETLDDYYRLKAKNQEFLAARMVVEIVDHFNHLTETQKIG